MKFLNDAILDVIGASSYVVMDTDYDTYGMVCTCQVLNCLTLKLRVSDLHHFYHKESVAFDHLSPLII